jgi:hypothetical protein
MYSYTARVSCAAKPHDSRKLRNNGSRQARRKHFSGYAKKATHDAYLLFAFQKLSF